MKSVLIFGVLFVVVFGLSILLFIERQKEPNVNKDVSKENPGAANVAKEENRDPTMRVVNIAIDQNKKPNIDLHTQARFVAPKSQTAFEALVGLYQSSFNNSYDSNAFRESANHKLIPKRAAQLDTPFAFTGWVLMLYTIKTDDKTSENEYILLSCNLAGGHVIEFAEGGDVLKSLVRDLHLPCQIQVDGEYTGLFDTVWDRGIIRRVKLNGSIHRIRTSPTTEMVRLYKEAAPTKPRDRFTNIKTKVFRQEDGYVHGAIQFDWTNPSATGQSNISVIGLDKNNNVVTSVSSVYFTHETQRGIDSRVSAPIICTGENNFAEIRKWRIGLHKREAEISRKVELTHRKLVDARIVNPRDLARHLVFNIEANVTFSEKDDIFNSRTVYLQALDKDGFEIGVFELFQVSLGPTKGRTVLMRATDAIIRSERFPLIHSYRLKSVDFENRLEELAVH